MTASAIVWGILALGYGVSTIQLFHQGWDGPPRGRVLPFVPHASPPTHSHRAPTKAA
jgi:hypothetical protein